MPSINKPCRKCLEIKDVKEFGKDNKFKDGLNCVCKLCRCEATREYRKANLEKVRERESEYREKNRKTIRERDRLARKKNPQKFLDRQRECVRKKWIKHYLQHRRWVANNPERYRELSRINTNKRRSTPRGRLNIKMSNAIRKSLNGNKNGRSWELLVGYSVEKLKHHLERLFQPGMTWENHGEWHIDHIVPIAVFNYEKPEDVDFKRCWALKNLQPLWKTKNLVKGKSLEKHFQPSLIFQTKEFQDADN